jgi:peptidyl-prolyl cis-trans isomerase C
MQAKGRIFMNKKLKALSQALCLAGSLLIVPGCLRNFFSFGQSKKQSGSTSHSTDTASPALLKIDGTTVLTLDEFDMYLYQVVESNPYFKQIGKEGLPMAVKQRIFESIVKQRLIIKEAERMQLDQGDEYQKAFDETVQLVKNSLLVQQFEKHVLQDIAVTDKEIQDEFDKNKQRYVKVMGGTLVQGCRFEKTEDANAFYDDVKGNQDTFAERARKNTAGQFKDFGRVTDDQRSSDIPAHLRSAVLEMKDVPAVIKVKDGDAMWVLYGRDKKDSVSFNFSEIKPQLESMLRMNKFKEVLDKRMGELRNKYAVDEFFKKHFEEPATSGKPSGLDGGVVRLPVEELEKHIKKTDKQAA